MPLVEVKKIVSVSVRESLASSKNDDTSFSKLERKAPRGGFHAELREPSSRRVTPGCHDDAEMTREASKVWKTLACPSLERETSIEEERRSR